MVNRIDKAAANAPAPRQHQRPGQRQMQVPGVTGRVVAGRNAAAGAGGLSPCGPSDDMAVSRRAGARFNPERGRKWPTRQASAAAAHAARRRRRLS